ncbi:hypothetical protein JG688_00013608 [Phytophthora aleatoria]|uniref:Uncharacterized protein n=1 Tax=Phytophthora aleatoria TaxID=2496075 RepID=A0A8J5MEB6_9STRA|nr:hypothetical protein JG688_00013608 [Phytophthora aleatoria]
MSLTAKGYLVQATVWDTKSKKGSYAKSNVEFHRSAVCAFGHTDGLGFYAEVA